MRILLAAIVLTACGPAGRDTGVDATSQPDAAVGSDAVIADTSRVYAHSGGMLYRLNDVTLKATVVGPLSGLPDMRGLLDLAVDKNDRLVGVTSDGLFSINAMTGATTLIKDLAASAQGFTSLSFVPATTTGTGPGDADILVSANAQGAVFEINAVTGTASQIGSYGATAVGQVKSSGDLFGVVGFGIYGTVDVGTDTEDYLAKIDPTNGWKATPIGVGTGFDKIFGLGYWGGKIYGFVDDGAPANTGKMIEIDPNTGAGTLLNTSDVRWFGAGVATDAPIQ